MPKETKHGPRQDEALKKDTESIERSGREARAEEWHEVEPPGEDQPEVSMIPEGHGPGGTPPGMEAEDVEGRSELARWLQRSAFPADQELLLASAAETAAPDSIIALLDRLPAGRTFQNVQDVWRALGGGTEDVMRRT